MHTQARGLLLGLADTRTAVAPFVPLQCRAIVVAIAEVLRATAEMFPP